MAVMSAARRPVTVSEGTGGGTELELKTTVEKSCSVKRDHEMPRLAPIDASHGFHTADTWILDLKCSCVRCSLRRVFVDDRLIISAKSTNLLVEEWARLART